MLPTDFPMVQHNYFREYFDLTHKKKKLKKKTDHKNPLVALAVYNAAIIFKPFMHNDEKWPNIHLKFRGGYTARFLKYCLTIFIRDETLK